MRIVANHLYHIYNQGNNRERIFYDDKDYKMFLSFFKKWIYPSCKILAWCLMPNHFHFLIYATQQSAALKKIGNIDSTCLSNSFRVLQSLYAQHINRSLNKSGSLFRQKAKAKCLSEGNDEYALTAFHYIHQNPLKAGLVKGPEEWVYSSYIDFVGARDWNLCDKALALELIGYDSERIQEDTLQTIDEDLLRGIYC